MVMRYSDWYYDNIILLKYIISENYINNTIYHYSLPHQKSLQHLLTSTPRRRTTDCQTRLPSERLPSPPHHHHHGRSSPQIHQPSPTPILSFIQPTDKRSCTQRFPSIPSLPLQTHLQDTRTTRHQSHPLISHYSPQPPYQDEDHTAHSTDS